jgi:hypothetical protein
MKYVVTRASAESTEKPCDEAVKSKVYITDWENGFKSFEDYDKKYSLTRGSWCSKGKDHKVTPHGLERKVLEEKWIVSISNLKQLQDFIGKYGECVIDNESILIYDCWIE